MSVLAPVPSIEQEFLSRIAAKHAQPTKVKATRPDRIKDFDPDRAGDTQSLALGGVPSAALVPSIPGASGGHNRDQGGKPRGKKKK